MAFDSPNQDSGVGGMTPYQQKLSRRISTNDVRISAQEAAINDLNRDVQYLKACLQHHGLLIAVDEDQSA